MQQILDEVRSLAKFVGERFDGVEARLDRVEVRLDRVESRLDSVEIRVTEVAGGLTGLRDDFADLKRRR